MVLHPRGRPLKRLANSGQQHFRTNCTGILTGLRLRRVDAGANMHARLCPKLALHACITAAASLSLLCTAAPAQSSSGSVLPEYEGFIRIENGRFVDSNCQEFSVTGMNTCAPFTATLVDVCVAMGVSRKFKRTEWVLMCPVLLQVDVDGGSSRPGGHPMLTASRHGCCAVYFQNSSCKCSNSCPGLCTRRQQHTAPPDKSRYFLSSYSCLFGKEMTFKSLNTSMWADSIAA